jgi:hypothetical protein
MGRSSSFKVFVMDSSGLDALATPEWATGVFVIPNENTEDYLFITFTVSSDESNYGKKEIMLSSLQPPASIPRKS